MRRSDSAARSVGSSSSRLTRTQTRCRPGIATDACLFQSESAKLPGRVRLPFSQWGDTMSDTTQITQPEQGAVTREGAEEVSRRTVLTPAVDVFEDSHAVTLWADLPGVPREKLEIKVHDGDLSIEAESVVRTPPNLRLSHAEVRAPYFQRRFAISDDFDTSKIEANLKDGVLKLTIPRREESKPRRIEVNVG